MADKKPIELSKREHPKYTENLSTWQLYEKAAKGGKSFMTDENLLSHRLEDAEDYDERLERSYFLNYCDAIPKIYNSYIFKEPIERKPDERLIPFRANVDGKGTTITDFMKRAGYLASVYGVMHILVDITESKKEKPTLADIRNDGTQPYCTLVYPTQLKDWSLDEQGNYNWVLIETMYYNDIDPEYERQEQYHYRLITKDSWKVVDQDGNPVTYEDGTPNSGDNKLGLIPLYTLYHADIDDDKIGESLIKDIVYVNRAIFNWGSCLDEQIERQTFSQLVVPDDGSLAQDEEEDPLNKMSTSSIWTFNADSRHPPAFISPNVDNLTTIWGLITDHIKEMYRMAGLQGGTSDLYTSRSGRQSQMNFLGVNSSLVEKALTYEKAENMISLLAYLQLGENLEEYEPVKYPSTFDVVGLLEEIDGHLKIMERNFSETLNKTMMKRTARRAVPMALPHIMQQIEDEIDAGDGTVTPVKTNAPEPEKGGQGNTNTNMSDSFATSEDKKVLDYNNKVEE